MSSSSPKLSQQEICHNLALLMNRDPVAVKMFGNIAAALRRRFWMLEPAPGAYRVLEQIGNQVLIYTTEKAVRNALIEFTAEELDAEMFGYKVTADKLRSAVDYWSGLEASFMRHKIYPVLELSEKGYCHHRLDFDAKDAPTPCFDFILKHIRTNQEAFLAFLGGLFDPEFRRQFYLWLYGVGGDGKGSIMRFLERLFQQAYAVCSSSAKAQESQFFTSGLVGKRIAGFQDCHNHKLPTTEIFMQLSGGDPLRIEPKGKDAYTARVDAIPIISANEAPSISKSPAHIRRAVLVEFAPRTENCGDEQSFEDRLWEERAAIVWKCKQAWAAMKAKGGLIVDRDAAITVADDTEAHYTHLTDKYLVIAPGKTMKQSDLHGMLHERERMNDVQIGHYKRFLQRLPGVQYVQIRDGNTRPRAWLGIGFKDEQYETQAAVDSGPRF